MKKENRNGALSASHTRLHSRTAEHELLSCFEKTPNSTKGTSTDWDQARDEVIE
jgi:hypothetical protein